MSLLDAAKNAAKQAGEAAKIAGVVTNTQIEITKRKKEVSSKQKMITAKLAKIGDYYYEKFKAGGISFPDELIGIASEIDSCNGAIEELEKQIEELSE